MQKKPNYRSGKIAIVTAILFVLGGCGGDSSVVGTPQDGGDTSGGIDNGNDGGPTDNGDTGDTGDTDGLPTADNQPNFLLIITDDQGLDASAQYSFSDDLPNTPVLDQLAADGIVFDNMWATPSCTTTRGSLLTGLHGVNSGVDTTPSLLDTGLLTVQKHLKTSASGQAYASGVFGKWHVAGGGGNNLLSHPNDSGADHYAGNIAGTIDDYFNWSLSINGVEQTSNEYHTTAITNMAIDWIGQQETPWFSWVAYVAPHSPFHLPPSDLQSRSLSGEASDINDNPREYFLAAIEAMDTEIGRLLDSIPTEERDNTIVMVLGDNGTPRAVIDSAAFPSSHGKSSLYEGGIRVPFVVSGGPVTNRNIRQSGLVNTVDILPTLSEAAGIPAPSGIDGVSFNNLLSGNGIAARDYNYSEFIGDSATGWVVRDANFKLIEFADGTREFYDLRSDIREESNIIGDTQHTQLKAEMDAFAANIRGTTPTTTPETPAEGIDITGAVLSNLSANCADYVNSYSSNALDVNNNTAFNGSLLIEVSGNQCSFTTNAIPNHDFNDGNNSFPNTVAAQNDVYTVTTNPVAANSTTPLSLNTDNAILLNGVKVDILAAACFGVGDERTGCNEVDQPWRFDPMFADNGFRVDTHNAHTQPDGTYHYHGVPNALFDPDQVVQSPVVGFAADGFPIYGSYFNDNGTIRKATSSYRLKTQARANGNGNPGGTPDGTYRDDYEYVPGEGDLDLCNGMTVNGVYGYYMIDEFPYVLGCFTGTPDESFDK